MIDLSRFKAVVLDLDGTLAGGDHRVSDFANAVVRRVAERGLRVIVSTGRSAANALALARAMGANAPVISANGAVVAELSDGRALRVVALEPATAAHYLTLADLGGVEAMIWSAEGMITAGPGLVTELMDLVGEAPIILRPQHEWSAEGVIKVLFAAEPEVLDSLDLTDFPLIQRSLSHFVEASAPEARKDVALRWLLDRLGIDPAETIVCGDAETDLESVRLAGLGVAPAGAAPTVREAADLVVGGHAEDGIAHFLEAALAASPSG
ncbi:MAG: HAD family hydrolase [Bifidobacteriaceae bacterium]|nr:HAD family hydrolase [Bifidobacteriaceae bacterium]